MAQGVVPTARSYTAVASWMCSSSSAKERERKDSLGSPEVVVIAAAVASVVEVCDCD